MGGYPGFSTLNPSSRCYIAPMRENDVRRFNHWAADYDRSWLQRVFFKRVQNAVLDIISGLQPHRLRLLDVGCGTGALLRRAAERFPEGELYGVDPAPEMVRVARELIPPNSQLHFVQAAAQSLPFPDSHFDVVASTVSFHHWGDQSQGLGEASRVLVPGGFFVLADMFAISSGRFIYKLARSRDRFHTKKEVKSLLNAAGLEVLGWKVVYRVGPYPALWAVFSRKPEG